MFWRGPTNATPPTEKSRPTPRKQAREARWPPASIYCCFFNLSRAEYEANGNWAYSMVLWSQPESCRGGARVHETSTGGKTPFSASSMPKAPTEIHDVASMSVQASKGMGQPRGQAADGSSMGAWAGLLRLLGTTP